MANPSGVSHMTEQQKSHPGLVRAAVVVVGILAVAAGIWFGLRQQGAAGTPRPVPIAVALKAGTLLPEPKPLEDFSLIGQDNRPLDRDSLEGHWTFMAFGYTYCPDICPTMMATFDALEKELSNSGAESQPEFLFISVDPERDTPEQVGKYVGFFNPRIRGATAGHDVLRPLTAQLGILYRRADEQETAIGYLVDHSASMLLLDPQASLAAIFSAPHDPRAMAEDYLALSARGAAQP